MQAPKALPVSKSQGSAGFTLVELAVCLCVIGILGSGSILGVSGYFGKHKAAETRRKMDAVMDALSVYAQTNYRLPCPADPKASAAQAGHEADGGKCFVAGGNAALYKETEGIVPWKELAIPQDMAVDGWGRYITYKPAPNLTVDTKSASMQDTAGSSALDIHNACRSALWYDAGGEHVNRAKALFCCNARPRDEYLSGAGQQVAIDDGWRKWGVVDAATAASIEPSAGGGLPDAAPAQITNSWTDADKDSAYNGRFSTPRYMDGPAAPLMRATGLAVVLISHGDGGGPAFVPEQEKAVTVQTDKEEARTPAASGNVWPPQMFAAVVGNSHGTGAGDIVSWQRSDQLFARVGSGSCEDAPAVLPSYSCKQEFLTGGGGAMVKDPDSGQQLPVPPLYNIQLGLAGKKYQLRMSLTKSSEASQNDDSLGFYEIAHDGSLQNVQLLVPSMNALAKNETLNLTLSLDGTGIGIGLFVIPGGFAINDGYKNIDLSHLKFVSGYALYNERNASVGDQAPPILVSVDPATGFKTAIRGSGQVSAYHLYSNLNPGHANHVLRPDATCHIAGERVGVNGDIVCARPTSLTGTDREGPGEVQIGFEDSDSINCYEYKDGSCRAHDSRKENEIVSDGEGGYVASVGDNSYDDVAFSLGFSACPESP